MSISLDHDAWAFFCDILCSDVAGVQHDTNCSTEGLGGDVGAELGTNQSRVAVGSCDLAPDNADLGAPSLGRSAVDICDAL